MSHIDCKKSRNSLLVGKLISGTTSSFAAFWLGNISIIYRQTYEIVHTKKCADAVCVCAGAMCVCVCVRA